MARDRKRAKARQRQRRTQRQPARVPGREEAASPNPLDPEPDTVRDAPPDPIDDASGDVRIAEAAEAAIADLDGPTTPIGDEEYPQADELGPEGEADDAEVEAELEEDEDLEADDDLEADEATAPARATRARGRELPREGSRVGNFLRACWAELQRVQWPDRRQVSQATAVVLVFVLIAGGYLGLLDAVFSRLVNAIL